MTKTKYEKNPKLSEQAWTPETTTRKELDLTLAQINSARMIINAFVESFFEKIKIRPADTLLTIQEHYNIVHNHKIAVIANMEKVRGKSEEAKMMAKKKEEIESTGQVDSNWKNPKTVIVDEGKE